LINNLEWKVFFYVSPMLSWTWMFSKNLGCKFLVVQPKESLAFGLNYGNFSFCVVGNLKVHYIHPLWKKVLQLMMRMTKISVLKFMIIHLDHLNHQHMQYEEHQVENEIEKLGWLELYARSKIGTLSTMLLLLNLQTNHGWNDINITTLIRFVSLSNSCHFET
jgi:hypothetical protein